MTCHLGDFEEYGALRRAISDREAALSREGAANRSAAAAASLEKLRPGDVIRVPGGRKAGLAVVLDPGKDGGREGPHPTVLTAERQVRRLSLADFPTPVESLHRLRIPKTFNARNPAQRRDLASTLRNAHIEDGPADHAARRPRGAAADDHELLDLRSRMRAHPCHGCAEREDHARWAERYWRLRRDTDALERRVRNRTNTISRTFDRITAMLDELGYLDGDAVTPDGRRLAVLYTELDLVAAESIRTGVLVGLAPAELASVVSALVFESRQSDDGISPRLPNGIVRDRLAASVRLWASLEAQEHEHRLESPREPDLGFVWATHRWGSGQSLDTVLRESDMQAGDFVRWTKQVIDLLGQVADAALSADDAAAQQTGRTARAAADLLLRGVVAYSSVA
jgi:ATP-dependent RNA helicase HelY